MKSTLFIPFFALAIGAVISIPLPWVLGGMDDYRARDRPASRRMYHRLAGSFAVLAALMSLGAALAWRY